MTSRAKRFLLSAGAVAMAVAMAGASVGAQNQNTNSGQSPFRGRGMGPGGPGGMAGPFGGPLAMFLGRAADRLGLTDAQRSQLKSIAEAHKSELQSLMQQMATARRALLTAQINGQSDDQIQQLWPAVANAESQIVLAETHIIAQAMQVLTPDQQTQLKQFVQAGPGGRGRQ